MYPARGRTSKLMITLFWLAFLIFLFPVGYLLLLALSSARASAFPKISGLKPSHHFAIALPAHSEERVIGDTVSKLLDSSYPKDLFDVYVVADHCTDQTAAVAQRAGALVHERFEGARTGKGAALSWLFKRILSHDDYDAIVIFDADSQVDPDFLRVMDARLAQGDLIIQGQHIIRNPDQGWFPALTWAMFLIDNRFQNLGRSNLGLSAKNMGDSICLHAEVIRKVGWGSGLTEDYELRQRLLLEGLKIRYEPRAKGYGEAPLTWSQANSQRARWLRGTRDANKQYARKLIIEGLKRRDMALLEAAMQAYFPSYSTLALVGTFILLVQLLYNFGIYPLFPTPLVTAWGLIVGIMFVYPFGGLILEGAPLRAYIAILLGPFFIVWRTLLAVTARYSRQSARWIRTPHGEKR